jgi:NTP pyrophosphatase (non-canonical NTP hydrolase)
MTKEQRRAADPKQEHRDYIRTRLDFPFEARTKVGLIGYCRRLEDELTRMTDRLKFALMYVPTEDGDFTFPDGDSWEAGSQVVDSLNFARVQTQVAKWVKANFGPELPEWHPILGVMEELGELCHSFLKQGQGIHLEEDHREKMADAVADIVIFLADFCQREGFLFQELMEIVLPKVLKRNWVAHREMYAKDAEEAVSS